MVPIAHMKKSVKKIEQALRSSLTEVCQNSLENIPGFEWITHTVDYKNFPNSLLIICVFDTVEQLTAMKQQSLDTGLIQAIDTKLRAVSIQLKPIEKHIFFDTEEACERNHGGNWQARLKQH